MTDKCDYSKGVIYKIKCIDRNIKDIYVGSTTNFSKRKSQHKYYCNTPQHIKNKFYVYQFIRAHGGWENWKMVSIKLYPCNSKLELRMEEERVIEELEEFSTLNRSKAYRSEEQRKEYHQNWQRENPESRRRWYHNNIEERRAKRRIYVKNNKDKKRIWDKINYTKHIDKILENKKKYHQKNREQISEKRKVEVSCPCGSTFQKYEKSRHQRSKKHKTWEQQPEPNLIFVD